jgi:hypothetical protein
MPLGRWSFRTEGGELIGSNLMDLTDCTVVMEQRYDDDDLVVRLTIEPRQGEVWLRRKHFRNGEPVASFPSLRFDSVSVHVLGEILVALAAVTTPKRTDL